MHKIDGKLSIFFSLCSSKRPPAVLLLTHDSFSLRVSFLCLPVFAITPQHAQRTDCRPHTGTPAAGVFHAFTKTLNAIMSPLSRWARCDEMRWNDESALNWIGQMIFVVLITKLHRRSGAIIGRLLL